MTGRGIMRMDASIIPLEFVYGMDSCTEVSWIYSNIEGGSHYWHVNVFMEPGLVGWKRMECWR